MPCLPARVLGRFALPADAALGRGTGPAACAARCAEHNTAPYAASAGTVISVRPPLGLTSKSSGALPGAYSRAEAKLPVTQMAMDLAGSVA